MGCCPSNKGAPEYPQTIDLKKQIDEAKPTRVPLDANQTKPLEVVEKKPEETKIPEKKSEQNHEEAKKNETAESSLITAILGLAKSIVSCAPNCLGRNQITKILIASLQQIDPTFINLSNNKVTSPEDLLKNLLALVQELKNYCEDSKKNLKKASSLKKGGKSNKIQSLRDSQGLLKKVGDYNDKINYLLSELRKPIRQEEERIQDKKREEEKAKELAKQLEGVIETLEANDIDIVGLCQNDLTNEEAFSFWMEKFPTKYAVPIEEFEGIFKEWLKKTKEIDLSEDNMAVVMRLINETTSKQKDLEINAKELNTFFENLPYEVDWNRLTEIEKEVADEQRQRVAEVEQSRKENEDILKKKVESVKDKETQEEKELSSDHNLIHFFVKGAFTLEQSGEEYLRRDFNVRNVFINAKHGEIMCFGTDAVGDEFKITGSINPSGTIEMQMTFTNGKNPISIDGNLAPNHIDGTLGFISSTGDFAICLDVDHWFGYYLQYQVPHDMLVCFKQVGNRMTGVSLDEVGAAFWSGQITDTELHMVKQMVQQHSINYDGFIKKKDVVTVIKGKWDIKGYTGGFHLSHNDEE